MSIKQQIKMPDFEADQQDAMKKTDNIQSLADQVEQLEKFIQSIEDRENEIKELKKQVEERDTLVANIKEVNAKLEKDLSDSKIEKSIVGDSGYVMVLIHAFCAIFFLASTPFLRDVNSSKSISPTASCIAMSFSSWSRSAIGFGVGVVCAWCALACLDIDELYFFPGCFALTWA